MPSHHGRFIWYELLTSDPADAKRFYGEVLGWTSQDMPSGEGSTYTVFNADGRGVGGALPMPAEAKARGAPICWTGYIAADDCDAAVEKLQRLGGQVLRAPEDIPGVGRFAVVTDPHGAAFEIMTPAPMETPPTPAPPGAHGHAGWRELFAPDAEAAFAFYAEMFGWTRDEAVDIGPMGVYQLFANADGVVGGMMNAPPGFAGMPWRYYFHAGPIEAAADRVRAAGGEVRHGPIEVPGGDWVLQAADPEGAEFGLIGTKS
jgi:predicted enzyme related to lactoylglutathione lyase